jgi:hypothetical protein
MNWSRYYLLPVVFASLLIGAGIAALIQIFIQRLPQWLESRYA